MADSLRVVLADRSAFVRTMLRTVLSGSGFDVVAETASGAEMVPLACDLHAHVVVSDLLLVDGELETFLPGLVAAGVRVVVLSDDRSPERFTAVLEAGASGYLLYDTSAEVVVEA